MNSRDRLQAALEHHQPDHPPLDFGATAVTGMHVTAVTQLRRALLGDEDYVVKVIEPYQMLGEIDDALRKALGVDVVGVGGRWNMFGIENKDWKPFTLFNGTRALVPGDFTVLEDDNGGLLIYPQGDLSAPPSGRMPRSGVFFDTIIRQEPIVPERLDPADNLEEFSLLTEADLAHYRDTARWIDEHPDLGVILTAPGAGFGDIALVPAPFLKRPKGIRDIEEWYVSILMRRDYILEVFRRQCEIAMANIETLINLYGDRVQAVFLTGTDFGCQAGPLLSRQDYREVYLPFHKRSNDLIHSRSRWKTFIHSCGSVYQLLPDFIEAGFDIFNPVQCSAAGMEARRLKKEFGDRVIFWGGGVDTQKTLPFGTPDEVYRETRERIDVFGAGGGFVFNAIHNIQANVPLDNILAMTRALRDSRV